MKQCAIYHTQFTYEMGIQTFNNLRRLVPMTLLVSVDIIKLIITNNDQILRHKE